MSDDKVEEITEEQTTEETSVVPLEVKIVEKEKEKEIDIDQDSIDITDEEIEEFENAESF